MNCSAKCWQVPLIDLRWNSNIFWHDRLNSLFSFFRLRFALASNEKVLICGPPGSGKGHLAKSALKEDASFITYGDLLTVSKVAFYESPRQRLFRLLETALIEGKPVILGHLEDLIEEPGLWFALTSKWFNRLQNANLPVICTINSDSNHLKLVKDHFLHIINIPKTSNFRFADIFNAEREKTTDLQEALAEMVREGRTCAQLSNDTGGNIKLDTLKMFSNENSTLTLDKFYGVSQEIKDTLLENASFSKGIKGARGILLYGPPGTGKTRLALALAGTLGKGTSFISIAAADLLRAEIGVSETKLREAFSLAHSSQPAVIFFDEIDALFPRNPPFHLLSLQHQLIAEFDALEREQRFTGTHCKILVLAASNHLQKIGNRILSVERIELQLEIGLPNYNERLDILANDLLRKDDCTIDWTSLNDEFILHLARITENKSPADLSKIIQDARKKSWKSNNDHRLRTIDFNFTN